MSVRAESLPLPPPSRSVKWRRSVPRPRPPGDCQVVRSRDTRSRLVARCCRDGAARLGRCRRRGAARSGWDGVRGFAVGLAPAWLQLGPGPPWGQCRCALDGRLRAGRCQRAGQAVRRDRGCQRWRGERRRRVWGLLRCCGVNAFVGAAVATDAWVGDSVSGCVWRLRCRPSRGFGGAWAGGCR